MKKYLVIAAVLISSFSALSQTNAPVVSEVKTNDAAKSDYGSYELTLGGGGVKNSWGLDVSLSTNPFEKLSSLWLGVAQGAYWESKFAGSTDVFADWSSQLVGPLYVNTGWSVGALYDTKAVDYWRTGPEVTFEYYIKESAFLYAGVNYDVWRSQSSSDNKFRFGFGIGLTW